MGAIFLYLFIQERNDRKEERKRWEDERKAERASWELERNAHLNRQREVADKVTTAFVENTKVVEGMKNIQQSTVQAIETLTENVYDVIRRKDK
jgi:hypothetical protein